MSKTESIETKLRHSRAEVREATRLIERLRGELRARRECGQMMSNLCFNLSQNPAYDSTHRQSMKDCQKMWDGIVRIS